MSSSARRQIPQTYRGTGGGEDLRTFSNPGIATVKPVEAPVQRAPVEESRIRVFVENDLAFSIFVLLFIAVFIYIILCFFAAFSNGINTFLLGVFKRPPPTDPSKYFDVNCINTMSYTDFLNPDQIQNCRIARPINRPGPPRRF